MAADLEGKRSAWQQKRAEAIRAALADRRKMESAIAKLGDLRLLVKHLRPLIADVERTLKP